MTDSPFFVSAAAAADVVLAVLDSIYAKIYRSKNALFVMLCGLEKMQLQLNFNGTTIQRIRWQTEPKNEKKWKKRSENKSYVHVYIVQQTSADHSTRGTVVNCRNTFALSYHFSSRFFFCPFHFVSVRYVGNDKTKRNRIALPFDGIRSICAVAVILPVRVNEFSISFRRHLKFLFRVNNRRKTVSCCKPQLFCSLSAWFYVTHAIVNEMVWSSKWLQLVHIV